MSPLIVPPSWAKEFDAEILLRTWERAVEVLRSAEVFVAIGFSMPLTDVHLRHLLHLGFSSGAFRQGLAVVGEDQSSAERWSAFFRGSWQENHFEVRTTSFGKAMDSAILPALQLEPNFKDPLGAKVLPLEYGGLVAEERRERFRRALEAGGLPANAAESFDVAAFARRIRLSEPPRSDNEKRYYEIVREAGFDWVPTGPILPSHGGEFPL
jgi:hypothetical protein